MSKFTFANLKARATEFKVRASAQPNKFKIAIGAVLVVLALILLNQLSDGFVFALLGWIVIIALIGIFIAFVNPEASVKAVKEVKEWLFAYRLKLARSWKELQVILGKKTPTIVVDEEPAATPAASPVSPVAPATSAAVATTSPAPAAVVVADDGSSAAVPPAPPVPVASPTASPTVAGAVDPIAAVAAATSRVRRRSAVATDPTIGSGTGKRIRKVTMPGADTTT